MSDTTRRLYLGLMSGTSMDGIDVALADFTDQAKLLAFDSYPLSSDLVQTLHSLCQPQHNEINLMGAADRQVAKAFAVASNKLLKQANVEANGILKIGSHGQTIRHHPDGEHGFTLQIGDGNTLAVDTQIDVVSNFRNKDIALGGQGAPLVPAFHHAIFSAPDKNRLIVNIGGISNLTYLAKGGKVTDVIGYDCGPGNTLMDAWCKLHTAQPFDKSGAWAASGTVDSTLLEVLLKEDFFTKNGPKSTGRELFNLPWLTSKLAILDREIAPHDVQATLLQFTVESLRMHACQFDALDEMYICGGGSRNHKLMVSLASTFPQLCVATTDTLGLPADAVEAMAFAWLAYAYDHNLAGNAPKVTGASKAAVLGALYLAN